MDNMDNKSDKRNHLKVIETTQKVVDSKIDEKRNVSKVTNPIYKNLLKLHHEQAGKKFSVMDLLR